MINAKINGLPVQVAEGMSTLFLRKSIASCGAVLPAMTWACSVVVAQPPPFRGFAPAGQLLAELVPILLDQVHAFAARIPKQIQVGRKMHVRFQRVRVHLDP